jgi:hypothetical protein
MSHPRLRPGLHVVRRDDRHLQVGVDPPWRLVLPDDPGVLRLLDDLAAGRPPCPVTGATHRALVALERAGLLVEPEPERHPVAVVVEGTGPTADEAARILRAAGCDVVATAAAEVALVLADGEPRRADLDDHVRDGRAHLVVAGTAYGVTIGPFVLPGSTACLRCVDAHLGLHDPRRAVVLEQVGGLPAREHDAGLTALVAGWAVRDLLSFAEGRRPSTWSATVEIGTDLMPRHRTWTRHPHCGCAWADGLVG